MLPPLDPTWSAALALAPAIPALSALAMGVSAMASQRLQERTISRLTSVVFGAIFLLSLVTLAHVWIGGAPLEIDLGDWFSITDYTFRGGFHIDRLAAAMMALTGMFLGIIGRFSNNYLHRDPGYLRFFLLLHVFATGMLILVMSSSYELLFMGWELVGIASTLLIAYFQERDAPVRSGLITFITYRIADVGLLLAIFMLHQHLHMSHFDALGHHGLEHGLASWATPIGLALLLAASGKSAQFPMGGWLPRAMEGPTPSSALFYGALSVHAGAYLLIRSEAILDASPIARGAILTVGLLTALHGALVGRVQTDAKSALAYAVMTQVGLIFALIGLGLYDIAAVALVAHACLRGFQLLRAPSALRDIQSFGAVSRGANLPLWLYTMCLERFYVDAIVDRFIVTPLSRTSAALDGVERALSGGNVEASALADAPRSEAGSPVAGIACAIAAGVVLIGQPAPAAAALVAAPLAIAALILLTGRAQAAMAAAGAAITLALSFFASAPELRDVVHEAGQAPWWALQVDTLGALLVPLAALLTLGAALALPKRLATPRILAATLALEGATMGILLTHHLGTFAGFWIAHMAILTWLIGQGSAGAASVRRASRVFSLHAVGSSIALLAGIGLLVSAAGAGALDLSTAASLQIAPNTQLLIGLLIGAAILTRSAVFPLHTWLLPTLESAPLVVGVMLVGMPIGAYALAHCLMPLIPDASQTLMPALLAVALIQVVYGAVLAVAQRSLHRTVGAVALSLAGVTFVGLSELAVMTLDGAILLSLATGLAMSGLLLVASALRARAGSTDLNRIGGLVRTMPRLTAWGFVFTVAAFGLPGSLSFVASDLVLQGTYALHPAMALVVLACIALNGMTLMRAWAVLFLGAPKTNVLARAWTPAAVDMRPREHRVALALAVIVLLGGLMPARLLTVEDRAARDLVQEIAPHPDAPEHAQQPSPAHTLTEN
jgi:NADH-quinone oxidoreductase subunit L